MASVRISEDLLFKIRIAGRALGAGLDKSCLLQRLESQDWARFVEIFGHVLWGSWMGLLRSGAKDKMCKRRARVVCPGLAGSSRDLAQILVAAAQHF